MKFVYPTIKQEVLPHLDILSDNEYLGETLELDPWSGVLRDIDLSEEASSEHDKNAA